MLLYKLMRKFFIPATIIFIIISWFVAAVYFVDYSRIINNLAKNLKINISDGSTVNFEHKNFPFLLLKIDSINEKHKIELKDIEVKFSLWSILSFNPKISDIHVKAAKIYLAHKDVNILSHDEFISELIREDLLAISAKIDRLIFIESDNDIALSIDNLIFNQTGKATSFTGEVNSVVNVIGEFSGERDNLLNFNLDIQGAGYNLKLNETYAQGLFKHGKAEIFANNLGEKLIALIPSQSEVIDKLRSNEQVKINFDINLVNNWLNLQNITINSPSITGSGKITLNKENSQAGNLQLQFDKINLASWSNNKVVNSAAAIKSSSRIGFGNTKLQGEITIKELQWSSAKNLTDVRLNFLLSDGNLAIKSLSGKLSETNRFNLNGAISSNDFRSIFTGKISITDENLNDLVEVIMGAPQTFKQKIPYSLTTEFKLSMVDFSLQNMLIKTADSEISGSVSSKFIGNSKRNNAILKFTNVNLDTEYPVLTDLYNYAQILVNNSKSEDYSKQFIPLRKADSIGNYDITIDQLITGNRNYPNIRFNLSLAPGKAKLGNLSIASGNNYLNTTVTLDASGVNPVFTVNIHDGVWETKFLSPSGMLELKKAVLSSFALEKMNLIINASLQQVKQGDLILDNVVLEAKNNQKLFEITKFTADLLGGKLISSGSVALDPYTINFSYTLNSMALQELAKLLPAGFISKDGAVSMSGKWSTNGETIEQQLYNLYTKSELLGKGLSVSDFSLDDFIQTIADPKYNSSSIEADLKQALLTGTTYIDALQASFELSKGIFTVPQATVKTKYANGSISAQLNLYDWNINLASIFAFSVNRPVAGKAYNSKIEIKLPIKAQGNLFEPKKEADTKELVNSLLNPEVIDKKIP